MERLGAISGHGWLLVGNQRLNDVDYVIVVWRAPCGLTNSDGHLSGDLTAFAKALQPGTACVLSLEDGSTVNLLITNYAQQESVAHFNVGASTRQPPLSDPSKIGL